MLILDEPSTWPKHIVQQLNSQMLIQICNLHSCIEDIIDKSIILNIFQDVESFATTHGIIGYHCTKQLSSSPFSSTGLRILNFQEHHAWFRQLIRQHPDINDMLYKDIDNRLTYWKKNHTGKRENMICFCLNQRLVLKMFWLP